MVRTGGSRALIDRLGNLRTLWAERQDNLPTLCLFSPSHRVWSPILSFSTSSMHNAIRLFSPFSSPKGVSPYFLLALPAQSTPGQSTAHARTPQNPPNPGFWWTSQLLPFSSTSLRQPYALILSLCIPPHRIDLSAKCKPRRRSSQLRHRRCSSFEQAASFCGTQPQWPVNPVGTSLSYVHTSKWIQTT